MKHYVNWCRCHVECGKDDIDFKVDRSSPFQIKQSESEPIKWINWFHMAWKSSSNQLSHLKAIFWVGSSYSYIQNQNHVIFNTPYEQRNQWSGQVRCYFNAQIHAKKLLWGKLSRSGRVLWIARVNYACRPNVNTIDAEMFDSRSRMSIEEQSNFFSNNERTNRPLD